MAFHLEKQRTGFTPYILIDETNGYMKFEGENFHENVAEFYSEISLWLKSYLKTDFSALTFDCELKCFNSSMAKLLFNLLLEMNEHAADGKKVIVNWITTAGNGIMMEFGEDFQEEMGNLEFNLVIKQGSEMCPFENINKKRVAKGIILFVTLFLKLIY